MEILLESWIFFNFKATLKSTIILIFLVTTNEVMFQRF